jgi:sugar phosphate isomerase/epimerase
VELHVQRDLTVTALADAGQRHDLRAAGGVKALEREASRLGVRICAFLLGNDFGKPDADEQVTWMTQTVRIAHQLGVPAVRVDAIVSGWEGMGQERVTHLFAEHIKRVLDATGDAAVDLGIENHGALGNRPEFLRAVLDAVGSPRLGLTLDTGNFYWFGHPLSRVYAIMQEFAPVVKHTHVKNIAYPPDLREQQRPIGYEYGRYVCPIPDGDIDHQRVVALLQAAGYDRTLCIEDESLGKFAPEERPTVLQRGAEHLKALLAG